MQLADETPDPIPSADDVREELQRLLASNRFDASERNRRFLSYVVEETLAGRADRIKAYTIAVAAFDRPEDFDPLADPIVRIEAGRLRRSLDHYYLTEGKSNAVRIDIPKGAYVATFKYGGSNWKEGLLPTSAAPASLSPQVARKPDTSSLLGRWRWGAVTGAAALAILVAIYSGSKAWEYLGSPEVAESPEGPSVLILPFQSLGGDPAQDFIAPGLTFETINILTRYNELFIYGPEKIGSAADSGRNLYVLSASVQSASNTVKVTAILSESLTGQAVWSETFERNLMTSSPPEIASDIADRVASTIASRPAS
jgi:TolB-like protein